MKAGTLSLAMMTPLIRPTRAAPATAAANPMTIEGNSGSPALKPDRIANAESTEARLITHPTERSMPALMMTNVCPSPRRRTGTIAIRTFCELRNVRKLTAPLLTIGTVTTKKTIIRPRNAHAHSRLSVRTNRAHGVRFCGGSGSISATAMDSRSATTSIPHESAYWGAVVKAAGECSWQSALRAALRHSYFPGTW